MRGIGTPNGPRTTLGLALATVVPLLTVTGPATAAPVAPATSAYQGTVREAARSLTRAKEVRRGYDRDKFRLWVDADGDGCDTRDEVLISEATNRPDVGEACALSDGRWRSYYDKVTTTDPSTFDIDHMVPLAEAWDSGARTWTAGTRERFANDLRDKRSLVAVTASSNRSKSDRDPAEWMPQAGRCRYIREWVVVKLRWRLSVNKAEARKLVARADACPSRTITVQRAKVVRN